MSTVIGRFAPSPTGRMHLGNVFAALMSWLSVRSRGGRWILRIEDLDPQRSKIQYAQQLEEDLLWLGLDWDEGGIDGKGPAAPYMQSKRSEIYQKALEKLKATGYTYPCFCTRADIMATQAPHQTDGRIIYAGTCRPKSLPSKAEEPVRAHSTRIFVPDIDICFEDRVFGYQSVNLAKHCGDFVLRRADGAWAYQLAVVIDDAAMGVTEVVRGCDLLLSAAQQIYLYNMLGLTPPEFAHLPLICNNDGLRLSKRDKGLDMEHLRQTHTSQEIIGQLAYTAGIIARPTPISAKELAGIFDWSNIPASERIVCQ